MANTRAELLNEVIVKITSGNRSTTAAKMRELLNDFINSAYIVATDGPPSSKFKGDWSASPTVPYAIGDYVNDSSLDWRCNTNGATEQPGTGAHWDLKCVTDSAYGAGWNGSLIPPSQNAVHDQFEAIDTVYFRRDGLYAATGDWDLNDNALLRVAYITGHGGSLRIDLRSGQNGAVYTPGSKCMTLDNRNLLDHLEVLSLDWDMRLFSGVWKTDSNFAIDNSAAGLVLKSSADSHYYQYTAGVAGALVITDLGTSI